MCKALHNEKAAAVALGMYTAKMPFETIAQIAQVSVNQVKDWLSEAGQ